jgi:preprotein translocase subunit Sec63
VSYRQDLRILEKVVTMQAVKFMNLAIPLEVRFQIEQVARLHYWNLQDVVIEAVKAFYVTQGEPGKAKTDECPVT